MCYYEKVNFQILAISSKESEEHDDTKKKKEEVKGGGEENCILQFLICYSRKFELYEVKYIFGIT